MEGDRVMSALTDRIVRMLLCLIVLTAWSGVAAAAEIKMLASNAVKEAYTRLVPEFEKSSGHHVAIVWGGTADIMKAVRAGEVQDIVITTRDSIDTLAKEDKLAQASRVDLAKSIIGVASRPGAPKPNLTSGETLKQSLLAYKKIVLSGGPSGVYLAGVFKKMGIADQIKDKTVTLAPGASAGEAVARGEGDIGFTQVSELLAVKGIDYLGPVPADVQQVTTFSAGLNKNAPQPEAAKALLKFLTSPAAATILKKTGLEPS
jgi:molybdate transport system substrate-binding protein